MALRSLIKKRQSIVALAMNKSMLLGGGGNVTVSVCNALVKIVLLRIKCFPIGTSCPLCGYWGIGSLL
jgi:hypothetical protein